MQQFLSIPLQWYYLPIVVSVLSLIGTRRLLLPFSAAGGAALSDDDADQRALGRPGAGGALHSR